MKVRMFDTLKQIRSDYIRHGRHYGNPAVWMLAVYRFGRWSKSLPHPLRRVTDRMYDVAFLSVQLATGSYVPREIELGRSPHFVHYFDIRIHPDTKIGDRVGIMHDVTIATTMNRLGAPVIGHDVFIGTGAKILGPVKIHDRAIIAPNSVVISDVPEGATAMGVPAKARRLDVALKSEWGSGNRKDPGAAGNGPSGNESGIDSLPHGRQAS